MIQSPNLDCKFIYGFLTLHWHYMSLGVGQGQNVGLRDFCHIWLCCRRGHPCFTNTCLVCLILQTNHRISSVWSSNINIKSENIRTDKFLSGLTSLHPVSVRMTDTRKKISRTLRFPKMLKLICHYVILHVLWFFLLQCRFVIKYRHCDGKLSVKMTDDHVVCKKMNDPGLWGLLGTSSAWIFRLSVIPSQPQT